MCGNYKKKTYSRILPLAQRCFIESIEIHFHTRFRVNTRNLDGINWFRLRIYLYLFITCAMKTIHKQRVSVLPAFLAADLSYDRTRRVSETCPLTVADFRDSRYPVDTTTRLRHDSNAPVTRCNARGLARDPLSLSSLSFFLSFFLSCARETAERRKLISHGRWTDIAAITLRGSGE